jgi:hypothetical protein
MDRRSATAFSFHLSSVWRVPFLKIVDRFSCFIEKENVYHLLFVEIVQSPTPVFIHPSVMLVREQLECEQSEDLVQAKRTIRLISTVLEGSIHEYQLVR